MNHPQVTVNVSALRKSVDLKYLFCASKGIHSLAAAIPSVVQLEEQCTSNPMVMRSIPTSPTEFLDSWLDSQLSIETFKTAY